MPLIKKLIIVFFIYLLLSTNSWSDDTTITNSQSTLSNKNREIITIQVSSLKKFEAAERELIRLKSHGLDTYISHDRVKDKGMWYRVYVGQFESRKSATAFAQKLVERGLISSFWVKNLEVPLGKVKPAAAEAIQPEVKKPIIEIQKPKQKIATEIKITPTLPSPIESLPKIAPIEIPKPKVTVKKKPLPEPIIREEEPPSISISKIEEERKKMRLSVGLKASLALTKKAEDFEITRNNGSEIDSWIFRDTKKYGGIVADLQLNERYAMESSIERALFTKLDLWQLSMGPKVQFRQIGLLTPFVRGALILGDLQWDDAPGNFDIGFGWEGGLGAYFIKSRLQIGLQTTYRRIKYNYNKPSGKEFAVTDDHIDLSGFALSGTLGYRF